ncbi:MAG: AMP-binding protein [Gammaproteobacteria bacterium]|nr:AMP-binding protein [Gammaproteobacteria bacterium]
MNRQDHGFRLEHCFEQQVQRNPGGVALYYADATVTFAELQASADRLLAALRAAGVRDGGFVGLHLERSPAYVAGVLAILKGNGAVVPLPPSFPESRLREILALAMLDAVVDDEKTPLASRLADRSIRFSDVPEDAGRIEAAAGGSPDQPAFVLCSSGSTGKPKMIVRSHRSFSHRLRWTWENHPYARGEVCCQKSHMTTTHAVYELFEPLLSGIPVCVLSDQQVRSLESFWETIRARGISRLLVVPSMLQTSLDMPGFVAPPLKVLVLMGEYVHAKLAARAIEAFPGQTKIFSIYGSTEASSTLVCDVRASFRPGEELPLGKPISEEVRALVLDDDLRPVAPGETGMLYVAGSPVFAGYFKQPALTDSVFTPAPGGDGRLYRTQDQVRRMPDGSLRFVGRVDHTVKIRGFRVDLQEVEKTLLLHPDVRQCAVALSGGEPEQTTLLAFVAPATVPEQGVFRFLSERLPAYMIPSAVVALHSLPLTASGKIDRRELLADYAGRVPGHCAGRYSSETARRVARVWEGVLKLAAVPPDRSFFELGGTSLTAFTATHRLRQAFGLDRRQLSDASLYRLPTVEALAAHVEALLGGTAAQADPTQPVLVTLKQGDEALPPLFVISSAGGTLGAYDKLVRALEIRRAVVGVRDPFLWGGRALTAGFQSWIALYVEAIRQRQPRGPYHLLAYSSAAAFGYEIARHLRRAGGEVAFLGLVDPLAMDCAWRWRFGYWALRARFMRRWFARIVRLGGWLRLAVPRGLRDDGASARRHDAALADERFVRAATDSGKSRKHILRLSALLELDSGRPLALDPSELAQVPPDRYLDTLLARVLRVTPEADPQTLRNLAIQYNFQVKTQHRYRLRRYDGKLAMFEPEGPCSGLLAAQFRPYVGGLTVHKIKLGTPSERTRALGGLLSPRIQSHFLCMRDDVFAATLAETLAVLLQRAAAKP